MLLQPLASGRLRPAATGKGGIIRALCAAALALLIVAPLRAQTQSPEAPGQSNAQNSDAQDQDATTVNGQSGGRMFGVLPNYGTVENPTNITTVRGREKFKMASLNTFDPYVYPFVAFQATLHHAYGSSGSELVKQYLASLTDNATGNFLTTAVLPVVLHQDPRYFQRGFGGFMGRVTYAASRSVVTRSDSGRVQFNFSEIAGNLIAAGVSNVYYPSAERTVSSTLSRWAMQVMWDTLSNELKEFWPDVRRKLHGR